jgi:hypothetical protein
LTGERVAPLVSTTVGRTYLAAEARSDLSASANREVAARRAELTGPCFTAASAIERLLNQLGEKPDRTVKPRGGGLAFVFLGGSRYAMLESDDDGITVAMLSDRSNDSEADTWVVEAGGLTNAVRKIRAFLGAPHGKNR